MTGYISFARPTRPVPGNLLRAPGGATKKLYTLWPVRYLFLVEKRGLGYNDSMNLAAVNAILLFALAVPLVMKYRILPIEGTPYWLFGVLFVLLITNVFISLFSKSDRVRHVCIWGSIAIALGGVMWTSIVDRARTAPALGVHDIILQQEAAMRYLIEGKNPYKETYFGTPVESFHYADSTGKSAVNPALYHFVMPPWYLLFPFVFYYPATSILGFFDGRMVLGAGMIVTLYLLWRWFKNKELGILLVLLTALSPATVDYFIEGRSDGFVLPWLVGALFALDRRKWILSGILMGLSLMSKQTTWIILPYYMGFLWMKRKRAPLAVLLGIVALLSAPFLLWDARAFIESTILYLSGNSLTSYPVSGYGLGMMLYEFGFIRDLGAYYPFIAWQLVASVPAVLFGFRWLKKSTSVSTLILAFSTTLFLFWYTSRYFNNSHVSFLSWIFALGVLRYLDEKS